MLLIVESISSNQKILMQLAEPIITVLLPVLLLKTKNYSLEALGSPGASLGSASADIRFLSLKIFTDIVI